MKNIILIVLLFTASLCADLTVQKIEKMISKIHEKRPGANLKVLEKTKEPFINLVLENNTSVSGVLGESGESRRSLHAIMNGKAYINENTMVSIVINIICGIRVTVIINNSSYLCFDGV